MRNNLSKPFIRKIFSFFLLAGILSGALPLAAQTRRTTKTPSKTVTTISTGNQKENCKGGWSGIITYQKTHKYTYESPEKKGVTTTKTKHNTSRDYTYKGRVVVDGSNDPRMAETKGQVSFTDDRQKFSRSEDREDCRYDKAPPIDIFMENKESEKTNAFGEGDAVFNLMIHPTNGTYNFSFRLPEAKGLTEIDSLTTAKQCIKKDYPPTHKKFAASVPGAGASIDNQLINPKNPDVLSGSKNWTTGSTDSTLYQHSVSWVFKRCPAPIEVTAIEFDENPYVNPWNGDLHKAKKTWRRITKSDDTIDGNKVRIRAKVVNFSGETKFPTIKFHELIENWELPGETSVRLEAGEEKEIAVEWDTSGYAWKGKGGSLDSAPERKIKVEAISDRKTSDLTETITVRPRPVVLVHGLWANAGSWNEFKTFFHEAQRWDSFAVGEDPKVGKMRTGETVGGTAPTLTIEENSVFVMNQIEAVREKLNAWHVDLVVHSMGGLISRYYIQNRMPPSIDEKPVVTKLIMLGTPNMGSKCADILYNSFIKYGSSNALRELKPSVVAEFNRRVTKRRGVRFSALVGKAIPPTCQSLEWGDGVVPISSARWEVHDWRYSNSVAHTDLTSHADFGGFVFRRLAIGPRGNHDIELIGEDENSYNLGDDYLRPADRYGFGNVFQNASYQKPAENDEER
jgi:triacylglycerol esterase/lipase EstA (alpha/beta hydrolase family)